MLERHKKADKNPWAGLNKHTKKAGGKLKVGKREYPLIEFHFSEKQVVIKAKNMEEALKIYKEKYS